MSHEDNTDYAEEDIETGDAIGVSNELLKEIAGWKLEAKAEDNDRYFFHVREVEKIKEGERCYVIGRKGSGKTAISEYFSKLTEYNIFTEKLTFKNFPFNELYSLKNTGYTSPNQYITLWKYVIYSSICKMMAKNANIESLIRDKLIEIYEKDTLPLARKIQRWVGAGFSINFPMTGGGVSANVTRTSDSPESVSWIEKVNQLEDFLIQNVDEARYFVLFDELDEDYRDMVEKEHYEHYAALITSLFKAVQDVKAIFLTQRKSNIMPIIFLRDDIYEIIQDSDKNKWNDFKIELFWDEYRVKQLLAFRLSRANDKNITVIPNFDHAWKMLMGNGMVKIGSSGKKINSFDYIVKSTYLRPRDFVAYLKACAEDALESNNKISGRTIKKVDKTFSNYLKSELTDELFAILPDILLIFDTLSQIRKWNFSVKEFEASFKAQR